MKNITTTTEVTSGNLSGLVIELIHCSSLRGMIAVRVTHKLISGFEARGLVAGGTTVDRIIEEVQNKVRIMPVQSV